MKKELSKCISDSGSEHILAWDPDFTKLTAEEKIKLEKAENDEFIDSTDIDWNNLEKYAD